MVSMRKRAVLVLVLVLSFALSGYGGNSIDKWAGEQIRIAAKKLCRESMLRLKTIKMIESLQ